MQFIFRYLPMQDVVDFALQTLRDKSPVGSAGDKHPGLYRDSHMVFLNGASVSGTDVSAWRKGDQINISNPEPYARKIEVGTAKLSVPGHVYEDAAMIVAGRYGNQVAVRFTFMPVAFGNIAAYAAFAKHQRRRRMRPEKTFQEWLVRQPALEIKARG